MLAYCLYILYWPDCELPHLHSEPLLFRSYRNNVPSSSYLLETFERAYKNQKAENKCPFLYFEGIHYVYTEENNGLMFLIASGIGANAMLIILFLKGFYDVIGKFLMEVIKVQSRAQIEKKEVNETDKRSTKLCRDLILDNCTLISELLDECMDFGIIQLADYNILKEYIKVNANIPQLLDESSAISDSFDDEKEQKKELSIILKLGKFPKRNKAKALKSTHNRAARIDATDEDPSVVNSSVLRTTSLAISWRPKGIYYPKNEIFFDIIETCDFIYDLESQTVRSNDIYGFCKIRCYLSGMPVCRIGFNETNISRIGNEDKEVLLGTDFSGETCFPPNQLKLDSDDTVFDMDESMVATTIVPESTLDNKEDEKTLSGTNDKKKHKIPISNIQFHQCIELDSIYRNNFISFIPPDGEFTLLSYRVEQQKQRKKLPLISIEPKYKLSKKEGKLQILCTLSTNFKRRLHCRNLLIKFPINFHYFKVIGNDKMKYKAQIGDVMYKVDSSELLWNIETLSGNTKSIKMMAELYLSKDEDLDKIVNELLNIFTAPISKMQAGLDDQADDSSSELDKFYGVNGAKSKSWSQIQHELGMKDSFENISMSFTIPMLSYSGLRLMYLSVEEKMVQYTCFPWVRYITEAKEASFSDQDLDINDPDKIKKHYSYRFKLGNSHFLCR